MSTARRHCLFLSAFPHRVRTILILLALLIPVASVWAQEESLGDYARRMRAQKPAEVLVSPEDGKLLFQSVDEITQFASKDSGLPRISPVKRQLIGRAETEKHFSSPAQDEAQRERRVEQTVVVLQKFGLLPTPFNLVSEAGSYAMNNLGGFYQFEDHTMYLLNWIAPQLQKSVMAHELTHALQDQNFHLSGFLSGVKDRDPRQMRVESDDADEASLARRAVVEGQATVVQCDYLFKNLGVSLTGSERVRQLAESYIKASYSPPITIHNAPRLLKEALLFPYREGLNFELELLAHGGPQMAFQGAFKRPPLNTHQILQPESYIANEPATHLEIPDLSAIFSSAYVPYESGSLGEFDVQIMVEEYGRENDIYTVARNWDGAAYVAVRRAGIPADGKTATGDLALVYLSRWKTRQAAERMGKIYFDALAKRVEIGSVTGQRCVEDPCHGALWEQHAQTSDGQVNIEVWPRNLLIVTQSVDAAQMQALRPLLLAPAAPKRASVEQSELAQRLFEEPQIQALSEQLGHQLSLEILRQLNH